MSGAPNAITLNGGDDGCNTGPNLPPDPTLDCTVRFTITAQALEIKFHWDYVTHATDFLNNPDPSQDLFGYLINSTFNQLSVDSGAGSQSGDAIVHLNFGDTFGFEMDCRFCQTIPTAGGPSATITNFRVPEPASLALIGIAFAGLGFARRRAGRA